jgi:hypothetical protein
MENIMYDTNTNNENNIEISFDNQIQRAVLEKSGSLGACPFCQNGSIHYTKKPVRGKMTKVYQCSNARWITEDGELFEPTVDSTCTFRIFGNALARYGKKFIGPKEVRALLQQKDVVARLYSFQAKKEYRKYMILSQEYGVSIDFETEVDDAS